MPLPEPHSASRGLSDRGKLECRRPTSDLRQWRAARGSKLALEDWFERPAPKLVESLAPEPERHSKYLLLVSKLKRALLRRRAVDLPKAFLSDLDSSLDEAAARLKGLGDDYDGEGSKGYSEEVVQRAADFVRSQAVELWKKQHLLIEIPDLGAGPDGTVDVHWRTAKYELLVNVPEHHSAPASFYGDDYGRLKVRGTIEIGKPNRGLLGWLSER